MQLIHLHRFYWIFHRFRERYLTRLWVLNLIKQLLNKGGAWHECSSYGCQTNCVLSHVVNLSIWAVFFCSNSFRSATFARKLQNCDGQNTRRNVQIKMYGSDDGCVRYWCYYEYTRQSYHPLVQLASFNVIASVDGDAQPKYCVWLSVACNRFGGWCWERFNELFKWVSFTTAFLLQICIKFTE